MAFLELFWKTFVFLQERRFWGEALYQLFILYDQMYWKTVQVSSIIKIDILNSGRCMNHIYILFGVFNKFFWNSCYADMILSKKHQHNSICDKNIFMHRQMHVTVSVQYMHAMERIYFCFNGKCKNLSVPPMVNTNQNQNQKHVGEDDT